MSKYISYPHTRHMFLTYFNSFFPTITQAKKDLSSHCDQIVMSLATLNKQRSVEKQSIRTTVTISKVSKTPHILTTTTAPSTTQSYKKIALDSVSETSTESPQTIREKSKSPDDTINVSNDINVAKKKELAKEKFFSSSIDDASSANEQRRGMFNTYFLIKIHAYNNYCRECL